MRDFKEIRVAVAGRSIWLKSRLILLPLWTGGQPMLMPTLW